MVMRESLRLLKNNLTFTRMVNRDYDDQFARAGAKVGRVVNARKPVKFTQTTGEGIQLQDIIEDTVPIALTTQYQRAFAWSSADDSLEIDEYSDRYIKPAIISIANQIDRDGLGQVLNLYNEVGTPGTVPNALSTYLAAGTLMNDSAVPTDGRYLVLSPLQQATILGVLATQFNPQSTISQQNRKGYMGDWVGFDWSMDQNTRIQTVGPLGGTPTMSSVAGQTGASILTTGWTASGVRLNKGDIFTLAGVFGINPQSYDSTGALQQFVALAQVTADGSGNATIPISPSIVISGPGQTVSAAPAALAAIVVNGAGGTATKRGVAFTKDTFTFVTADLPLYKGTDMCERRTDKDLNISMRVWRDADINTDRAPFRIDVLGGWATLMPETGVRIAS